MTKLSDCVGMSASGFCVVHCLLTPVLPLLPLLGWSVEDHAVHQALAFVVVAAGLLALLPGYRAHGKRSVLALGLGGIALVAVAAIAPLLDMAESLETVLSIGGGLMVFAAHFRNLRLCRHCAAAGER